MNRLEGISVVTPTLHRPDEIRVLLKTLNEQTVLPLELVVVDGAPEDRQTEELLQELADTVQFEIRYFRSGGGTALQRNYGIDRARGRFVAFIDDDMRLNRNYFEVLLRLMDADDQRRIGAIGGFIENQAFRQQDRARWRWYKRLGLLSTFEPGRYDFQTGIVINRYGRGDYRGMHEVDSIGTNCALWRAEVFDEGLRFADFFRGYAVLEDHHLALTAGKRWKIMETGDARCIHDHSPRSRTSRFRIGYMCVVNYYFTFQDVAGPLSLGQQLRFWRFQTFEVFRIAAASALRLNWSAATEVAGRLRGFCAVATGKWNRAT